MNTAITNLRFLAFIYSLVNIYSTILSPLSIEVKIHDNAHMWDSMCLRFQLDHFLRFCIGQCPIRRFVYFEILIKNLQANFLLMKWNFKQSKIWIFFSQKFSELQHFTNPLYLHYYIWPNLPACTTLRPDWEVTRPRRTSRHSTVG